MISISHRITPICHAWDTSQYCISSDKNVTVYVKSHRRSPEEGTSYCEVSEHNARSSTSFFRRSIVSWCLLWFRLGWWFGETMINQRLFHSSWPWLSQLAIMPTTHCSFVFNWSRVHVYVRLCTTDFMDQIIIPWMSSDIRPHSHVWW